MRPTLADQQYTTSGEDVYRIASSGVASRILYTGVQHLSVQRQGRRIRFEAKAHYEREGPDGASQDDARFVQVLLPDGSFEDRSDTDPDFLTILNQPFAVELDGPTLRDIRQLHGRVPFNATSPFGGSTILRGYLRPGTSGPIDGRWSVAVRFEADGPISGPLPGRGDATVAGRMHMDGVAYYAVGTAFLLALNATLTITARLYQGESAGPVPVRITYHRSIRATHAFEERAARTPLPAPPATDAGTGPPATP